jgi:hypothetical protein
MSCNEIRNLIPDYINHTASQDNYKSVEEHLCICNACREHLGKVMDESETSDNVTPKEELTPIGKPFELTPDESTVDPELPQKELLPEDPTEENEKEEIVQEPPTKTKPLKETKLGSFEYLILGIGLFILLFFIWLLLKG